VNRPIAFRLLALLATMACLADFSAQAADRKPNFLLILIRAGIELEKVAAAGS
jgi:hypothetical protein